MSKLLFGNNGGIEPFISWLDRFKGEISRDSITIEVDTVGQMFISKTYTDDKGLVRFSQISFEDAHLELKETEGHDGQSRILVGLFMVLPKFIEILKTINTATEFTIDMSFGQSTDKENKPVLAVSEFMFRSKTLTLRLPGCSVKEIPYMNDETFFGKVWKAPTPIQITVTPDVIKNIISISDIYAKFNKQMNYMMFYTRTEEDGSRVLCVKDGNKEDSYDYVMGPVTTEKEDFADVSMTVYRDKFLLAVKNALDETTFSLSTEKANRLLIELKGGNTKTIIARLQQAAGPQ
jgi:hypothetical protein